MWESNSSNTSLEEGRGGFLLLYVDCQLDEEGDIISRIVRTLPTLGEHRYPPEDSSLASYRHD